MPATNWGSWSGCSTTCGNGIQTRTRTCAYNQGIYKLDIQACNVQNCCGEWGSWGDCSKTCGVGIKHKTKTCFAGISYSLVTKDCIIPATDWSSWSDCSTTCGNGVQTRTRSCDYNQDSSSHEAKTEQKTCFIQECCNDTWTTWSTWDACSNHGAVPFKQQRSRRKFVQAACSQEGKSVQTESETKDCLLPVDNNLPADYTYARKSWGNLFFKIYGARNYAAAKAQCESDGAFLAIPRSEAQNDFIADLIRNENIWIGINDIASEGSFVAVDGRAISWTKWHPGEPNSHQANQDAAEIWQNSPYMYIPKAWNDANVDDSNKFVCISN